jgi:LPXTG-motif cell wall-anchored protein
MTGPEDLWPFAIAGVAALALGGIAVWSVREQQ